MRDVLEEPVTESNEGALLALEVTPGAAEDRFPAGYNPWRGRIQARVTAQAQEGQANQALCQLVADHLGLDAGDVVIKTGATSRRKTLLVVGLDADAVRARLSEVIGP